MFSIFSYKGKYLKSIRVDYEHTRDGETDRTLDEEWIDQVENDKRLRLHPILVDFVIPVQSSPFFLSFFSVYLIHGFLPFSRL